MANLRILYNNLTDTATITASTTRNFLVASRMQTDIKSEVHRSVSTSVTYTVNWGASTKSINCVILPCTNLSSTSTIRIRLLTAASALLYDSGVLDAVPGWNLELGSAVHTVNEFAYGLISKTAVWFLQPITGISKIEVILDDPLNSAGFIDCSRILAGIYWEPSFNSDNGIQIVSLDDSIISQTHAGELVYDRGFIRDKLNFNYSLLSETDRSELNKIIKFVGIYKNFFISVFPEYEVPKIEHEYMLYGKRSNNPITYKLFGFYNHSMEILSW